MEVWGDDRRDGSWEDGGGDCRVSFVAVYISPDVLGPVRSVVRGDNVGALPGSHLVSPTCGEGRRVLDVFDCHTLPLGAER